MARAPSAFRYAVHGWAFADLRGIASRIRLGLAAIQEEGRAPDLAELETLQAMVKALRQEANKPTRH